MRWGYAVEVCGGGIWGYAVDIILNFFYVVESGMRWRTSPTTYPLKWGMRWGYTVGNTMYEVGNIEVYRCFTNVPSGTVHRLLVSSYLDVIRPEYMLYLILAWEGSLVGPSSKRRQTRESLSNSLRIIVLFLKFCFINFVFKTCRLDFKTNESPGYSLIEPPLWRKGL